MSLGPNLATRRILTAQAYDLLLAAQPNAGLRKDVACFDWDGKYYEVMRYSIPRKDGGEERRCVVDHEVDAGIPPWMEKFKARKGLDLCFF